MAHSSLNTSRKALIIAPAWVGDMVMAHTLVQRLAEDFDELHVAAPPATAPLGERMAEVSQVHVLELAHGQIGLGARRRYGKALAGFGFDAAFILPNSLKSALVPWFAGIPRRVGWHGEARYGLLNDRRHLVESDYPLMIERFMALADESGALPDQPYPVPRLEVDADNLACLRARFDLGSDRRRSGASDSDSGGDEDGGRDQDEAKVLGLCPGAEFGPAKQWPSEHYAELAAAARARGWHVWLFGSPKDRAVCDEIAQRVPGLTNLAGETRLADAIDLLSACDSVVCNDSGLMHVACAVGVHTLGIYGSTSPGFTPPLGRAGVNAAVVELDLDCRPCFQRTCPLGHLNCLRELHPDRVLARLEL